MSRDLLVIGAFAVICIMISPLFQRIQAKIIKGYPKYYPRSRAAAAIKNKLPDTKKCHY